MSDTPQIESTAIMLRHAGYEVKVCGAALRHQLANAGLDTVLSVESMIAMGYDPLEDSIGEASPRDLQTCDLFVEIKVRNVPKLWERWPRLRGRTAWWRVNGAQPEICPKGGDEVNLPCPVITACLWYGTEMYRQSGVVHQEQSSLEHLKSNPVSEEELRYRSRTAVLNDNGGMGYTFWPPYPRSEEYDIIDRADLTVFEPPYCVCHSGRAWGYAPIIDQCVNAGVRIYGNNSPHGQISHRQVPGIAAKALALVHLKSVDCPGWALYEAILAGCPVITGRLLNSRMLAYDLLEHGKSCYEFGVPASLEYGRGEMEYEKCLTDIRYALKKLRNPAVNHYLGAAVRDRLKRLMWNTERDGPSFIGFMNRHYS